MNTLSENSCIAPPFLEKGDTIAIISSARKISKQELEPSISIIEKEGYRVLLGENIFKEDHQYSGNDLQRISDLHDAFQNTEVKAILFARGGYGSVRLLELVDLEIIKSNPKWIIGYSDVTVFHSYFHEQIGIQTIHGSMPINFGAYQQDDLPIQSLFNALEGKKLHYEIESSADNKLGGTEGIIVGGNLSIIYSLRGTLADVKTDNKILFIEDLDEYLYHIDRMMMNLKIGRKLDRLKALVVGGMSDMNDNTIPFGKTAKEIILDAVKDFDYPVLFDFPAGHIKQNYALRLGSFVRIEINTEKAYLDFIA